MARELLAFGSATPPADAYLRYDTSNAMNAQSFKLTGFTSPYISSVKFYMKKVGAIATTNMYAEIHSSTTGTSQTVGESENLVDTSAAVSTSTLTTSYAEVEFTFSGAVTLTPETTYYIVLYASGVAISSTKYIKIGNNTGAYSNGQAHKISTTNVWAEAGNYDFTTTILGQEAIVDSGSDILMIADTVSATVPAYTDYRYYMGSFDGKVYQENPEYYHDDNQEIACHLITKVTDKADQYPEAHGALKTVYFVRLWYQDRTENASVTVGVSNDEGESWTEVTKLIGNGDGKTKCKDYFFPVTGHTLQYKVENESASDNVQFIALAAFFIIGGRFFNF